MANSGTLSSHRQCASTSTRGVTVFTSLGLSKHKKYTIFLGVREIFFPVNLIAAAPLNLCWNAQMKKANPTMLFCGLLNIRHRISSRGLFA
jgi:hypothetical protein